MPPLCALLKLNRANDEKIPLGGFKPATVIRIPADLWTTASPPLYNWSGYGCVYHWTTDPPPPPLSLEWVWLCLPLDYYSPPPSIIRVGVVVSTTGLLLPHPSIIRVGMVVSTTGLLLPPPSIIRVGMVVSTTGLLLPHPSIIGVGMVVSTTGLLLPHPSIIGVGMVVSTTGLLLPPLSIIGVGMVVSTTGLLLPPLSLESKLLRLLVCYITILATQLLRTLLFCVCWFLAVFGVLE